MERKINSITYVLTYKNVKNLNIRVTSDYKVKVSANPCMTLSEIDAIIAKREDWILSSLEKIKLRKDQAELEPECSNSEALRMFEDISNKIYPLFSKVLKEKPEIQVKTMKSRWGVCHVHKNRIVLNKMLVSKPKGIIEYVVLHEYVHFLHPNHQKGFHDLMFKLMPDYKERRKLLNKGN